MIDNASSDATPEIAAPPRRAPPAARPNASSWAEANNAGIDATDGPAVLLLNADCFLEPRLPRRRAAAARRAGRRLGHPEAHPHARARTPAERLDAIDCVGMVVDRRRKNNLAGHGSPALAYDLPGDGLRPRRRRRAVPARDARRLPPRRRGARPGDGEVGVRRGPRLARLAARLEIGLRARGGRLPCPFLRALDPRAGARARPPRAVPQPLPDDGQERHLGAPARPAAGARLRDRSRLGFALLRERHLLARLRRGGAAAPHRRSATAASCAPSAARAVRPRPVPFGLEPAR